MTATSRELARIRSVVMLNCPNSGSEYLRSVRHFLGFRYHPQIGSLKIHDKQVADTQRTVLQRVVNAAGVDNYQCRIPFHVYAGNTDKIVNAASAPRRFPWMLCTCRRPLFSPRPRCSGQQHCRNRQVPHPYRLGDRPLARPAQQISRTYIDQYVARG